MDDETVGLLVCPECKSDFDVSVEVVRQDDVTFGWLSCPCSEYPILGGVPVLRDNALVQLAADQMERGQYENAVRILLNESVSTLPFQNRLTTITERAEDLASVPAPVRRYLQAAPRLQTWSAMSATTYEETITRYHDTNAAIREYFLYRPFESSFWNLHALLPLLAERTRPILDLGGGYGHAARLLRVTTDRPVCNVDISFRYVYPYKRFVDPDGFGIVVEEGMDLPFPDGAFGDVLNLDGYHYVPDKYKTASEFERVVRDDGSILLLHAHTRRHHPVAGSILSPAKYEACFSRDGIAVPERELLGQFLGNERPFGLDSTFDTTDNLNLVFPPMGRTDVTIDPARNPLSNWSGPTTVNPIYERSHSNEILQLSRRPVTEKFRNMFRFSFERTDDEYTLGPGSELLEKLLYRGVLTVLPEQYAGSRSKVSPDTQRVSTLPG